MKLNFIFHTNISKTLIDPDMNAETKTKLLIRLGPVYMTYKWDGDYLNPSLMIWRFRLYSLKHSTFHTVILSKSAFLLLLSRKLTCLSQCNVLNILWMLRKLEVLVQDEAWHTQCGVAFLHPQPPAMYLFNIGS